MLTNLRSKIQKDEEGFTLVELMVVVLIMAILMAIAIPTFLGAQGKAKDSSVKADLRNAMTSAKSLAADQAGSFTTVTDTALTAAEPSITFGAASTDAIVGVFPHPTDGSIALVKKSKSGDTWFAIASTSGGLTKSCSGGSEGAVDSYTECAALSATSWTS